MRDRYGSILENRVTMKTSGQLAGRFLMIYCGFVGISSST